MRLWKFAGLVLVVAFASSACAARSVRILEIAPHEEDELWFLFTRKDTEFAFCLYGEERRDGTLFIERIEIARVTYVEPDYIEFDLCEKKERLLGYGHSHTIPNSWCRMSRIDIDDMLGRNNPFAFVFCERGIKHFSRAIVLQEDARRKTSSVVQKGGSP